MSEACEIPSRSDTRHLEGAVVFSDDPSTAHRDHPEGYRPRAPEDAVAGAQGQGLRRADGAGCLAPCRRQYRCRRGAGRRPGRGRFGLSAGLFLGVRRVLSTVPGWNRAPGSCPARPPTAALLALRSVRSRDAQDDRATVVSTVRRATAGNDAPPLPAASRASCGCSGAMCTTARTSGTSGRMVRTSMRTSRTRRMSSCPWSGLSQHAPRSG